MLRLENFAVAVAEESHAAILAERSAVQNKVIVLEIAPVPLGVVIIVLGPAAVSLPDEALGVGLVQITVFHDTLDAVFQRRPDINGNHADVLVLQDPVAAAADDHGVFVLCDLLAQRFGTDWLGGAV